MKIGDCSIHGEVFKCTDEWWWSHGLRAEREWKSCHDEGRVVLHWECLWKSRTRHPSTCLSFSGCKSTHVDVILQFSSSYQWAMQWGFEHQHFSRQWTFLTDRSNCRFLSHLREYDKCFATAWSHVRGIQEHYEYDRACNSCFNIDLTRLFTD